MATTVEAGRLIVLDPTVAPDPGGLTLNPRLQRLRGTVAGLLDNSKPGAAEILEKVGALLKARYGVKDVVVARKNDASTAAPLDVIDLLVRRCNFVVAGVGD